MKESQDNLHLYQRPILHFNGINYKFSNIQLIVFLVGSPLLSILIYYFLTLKINYWVYELTTKQIVLILNTLLLMNSQVIIDPEHNLFPHIFIPDHPFNGNYSITPNCIAAHIFSILIGIIIFIPASKDSLNRNDFILRKIETLVVSVIGIYILNIFRISFLLFFNFHGIPFEFIHESLFFLSAIIGALFFVLLLKKWLPEIYISIYYLYRLISQKKKQIHK
ncbi:MAG: exosortase/archaeosortase family protein [Promethearchaeota archaeon]